MSNNQGLSATELIVTGQVYKLAELLKASPPSMDQLRDLFSRASQYLCLPILEIVVNNGWDINTAESYYEPPFLGLAIKSGASSKVVQWFLDKGADPNAYAEIHKVTPLSYAIQYASLEIIQLLFKHGGDAKKGDLVHCACRRPVDDPTTLELLDLLYKKGAPIDEILFETFPKLCDITLFEGTPLWQSCILGNTAAVRFLLDHDADPILKPLTLVNSPLRVATEHRYDEIIMLLTERLPTNSEEITERGHAELVGWVNETLANIWKVYNQWNAGSLYRD